VRCSGWGPHHSAIMLVLLAGLPPPWSGSQSVRARAGPWELALRPDRTVGAIVAQLLVLRFGLGTCASEAYLDASVVARCSRIKSWLGLPLQTLRAASGGFVVCARLGAPLFGRRVGQPHRVAGTRFSSPKLETSGCTIPLVSNSQDGVTFARGGVVTLTLVFPVVPSSFYRRGYHLGVTW
jgi:hypothetical protein